MGRNKIFLAIIGLSALMLLNQCSGCSRSGREELADQQSDQQQAGQQQSGHRQRSGQGQSVQPQIEQEPGRDMNQQPQEEISVPGPSPGKEKGEANDLSSLYKECKKAVFLIYTSGGQQTFQGSGFFINDRGVAVSNYHVFEDTQQGKERIYLDSDRAYKIERVLRKNEQYDYIVFRVNVPGSTPYLEIAGSSPAIGAEVFTIGNPKGLEQTLSTGIISGYRKENRLLQTTTEITHGSSGGPLMNMQGQVVGITTMGMGEANLNFAVNINLLELSFQ